MSTHLEKFSFPSTRPSESPHKTRPKRKKQSTCKGFAPLPSDKQRLKSTPNIPASPLQQKNNTKKRQTIFMHLEKLRSQSIRLAGKHAIATKQQ
jgi:hypothetical protein